MANKKQAPKKDEFQMAGVLKLRNNFFLDGKLVTELPYDFDELTAEDMVEADKERTERIQSIAWVQSVDMTSLLCVFARAVAYKLPNCDVQDIMRLKARDAFDAVKLARGFFTANEELEESEEPKSSAE